MRNLEKRSSKHSTRKRLATQAKLKVPKTLAPKNRFVLQNKKAFLVKISHALRTRLNAIIGFSEMLRNEQAGSINSEQKEYLNDIISSAKDLSGLLNQKSMRTLSKKTKSE